MAELLRITPLDNVAVALSPITKGQTVSCGELDLTAQTDVPAGHKIALEDIPQNGHIIKYGFPIGYAKEEILKGSHIHVHNLHTLLGNQAVRKTTDHRVCCNSAEAVGPTAF